jgi:ABC-type transport system involved in multi-copper enzyme maturation permease subunit
MKILIWKEWREQRLFFFLAVGIIFLTRFLLWFFRKEMASYYEDALGIFAHFIIPILFCLFLGVIPFTNEFTRNTKPFLLSHPVTAAKIFWVKFFSGLFLLIILITLSHFVFGVDFGNYSKSSWPLIYLFLSAIILYSSAFLSSLLLKNTLPAILITPFILLSGIFIVFPLIVGMFLIFPSFSMYVFFTCSVIVAVFLVVSFTAWRKSAVKDLSCWKTVPLTVMVILFISFGSHGILNLAVTSRLNTTIQQAKAENFKLTLEEVIPPPVPDEKNAALVYKEAFKLADRLKDKYKEEWEYMPYESRIKIEELTTEQKRAISRIMRDPEFVELYALIEKAVNMPACRFEIKYEEGALMLLPHHEKMRSLVRLTAARTYILATEGKYREALKFFKTQLGIGDSLKDEPFLHSQLVRFANDVITMNSFRFVMSDVPEGMFSSNDYREIIGMADVKNRQFTVAIESEPVIYRGFNMESIYIRGTHPLFMGFHSYILRPVFKAETNFYMKSIMTLVSFSSQPFYSIKEPLGAFEQKIINEAKRFPRYIMARMAIPSYATAIREQAKYNTYLGSFKLALALRIYREKHSNYPDTLSPLVPEVIPELPFDPFTGKDYIYRREGKGFIVYSVGLNQKDDSGKSLREKGYDDIAFELTH